MKKITCFTFKASESGRRFVCVYEKETKAVAERYKPKEGEEKLEKFDDIKDKITGDMAAAKKDNMDKIKSGHDVARASEKKELEAIDQKTPKGKKEHAEKKKQFDKNEEARVKNLKDSAAEFETAAINALADVKTALDAAHKKRQEAAENFAKSMTNELMNAETQKRKADADKNVNEYFGPTGTHGWPFGWPFQGKVSMPNFRKIEGGGIATVEGPDWDAKQVESATREMIKAIYVEQGPAAAKAKVAELGQAVKDVKEADRKVNYFSWHKAFGGHNRGGFAYVLDTMHFDTKKGPEAFGKVVGYMNSADTLFKGANDKYFAKYEEALKQAVNEGKDCPSPSEWARQNAPEMFAQPKEAGPFVDKVLESYLPKPPSSYEAYKGGWYPGVESIQKEGREYDEKIAKKGRVRAVLLGALAAEPDSSKWDALAKRTLTTMLGGTFDAAKISEADPAKVMENRELYGDVGGKLDDESKAYISGMIAGADYTYGGKTYDVMENGKVVKKDFVTRYKDIVRDALTQIQTLDRKPGIRFQIQELENDQYREERSVRDKNDGKLPPAEKARIEASYRQKVYELVSKSVPSAKDAWKAAEEVAPKEPEAAPKSVAAGAPKGGPAGAPKVGPEAGAAPAAKPKSAPKKAPATLPAEPEAPSAAPIPVAVAPGVAPAPAPAGAPEVVTTVPESSPAYRYSQLKTPIKTRINQNVNMVLTTPGTRKEDIEKMLTENVNNQYSGITLAPGEYMTGKGVRIKYENDKVTVTGVTDKIKKGGRFDAGDVPTVDKDGREVVG